MHSETASISQSHQGTQSKRIMPLVVGAIGIVFGDIGTSPLYTLQQVFSKTYGLSPDPGNVLGVLSLIFWSLILVITVKYVAIVMRADNRGEGGILALMAVVQRSLPISSSLSYGLGILGIFGTALFFGDGVITPAISVLSAIEGLGVVAPSLSKYVVPATIVVLLLLFSIQRHGVAGVGKLFGPITVAWFLAIGATGAAQLIKDPAVLQALNPAWAFDFFLRHGIAAWLSLGAVVLAVTGGEALYADMGHFGRYPIRLAWLAIVLPCLLLNYFGQGALILSNPSAVSNPFYLMVPNWFQYPMIVLATLATVIASQALISGTFSVVRQAIQLGYLPRMLIIHTSSDEISHVYVPWVNRALMVAVMVVVVGFGSSGALGIAYGVSVTGTMLITTILTIVLASERWRVPLTALWFASFVFVAIDIAFLSANLVKFMEGAWFPLLIGLAAFTVMRTWRRGRDLVRQQINRDSLRIEHFVHSVMVEPPLRVPGTAIFMTPSNDYLPPALLHNLKHNQVLHERNVILTVETLAVPRAEHAERVSYTDLGNGFSRLNLRFGYMEDPNVPKALKLWQIPGPHFDPMTTTFFASREALSAHADQGMALWRDKLFLFMSRNATPATEFFSIPGNRLVELGVHVAI
ncbi:MAG: potassium transporter Kup [Arenimonas sp.]